MPQEADLECDTLAAAHLQLEHEVSTAATRSADGEQFVTEVEAAPEHRTDDALEPSCSDQPADGPELVSHCEARLIVAETIESMAPAADHSSAESTERDSKENALEPTIIDRNDVASEVHNDLPSTRLRDLDSWDESNSSSAPHAQSSSSTLQVPDQPATAPSTLDSCDDSRSSQEPCVPNASCTVEASDREEVSTVGAVTESVPTPTVRLEQLTDNVLNEHCSAAHAVEPELHVESEATIDCDQNFSSDAELEQEGVVGKPFVETQHLLLHSRNEDSKRSASKRSEASSTSSTAPKAVTTPRLEGYPAKAETTADEHVANAVDQSLPGPPCQSSRDVDDLIGESALTAGQRIDNAFSSSNVDFPMITDICERVSAHPQEALEAVQLLAGAFGDRNNHPRRRLQALTIMHELVYDQRACAELRALPGSKEMLQELQRTRNTGLGEATDEHIRMFATELQRVCFSSDSAVDAPPRRQEKAKELFREISFSLQANLASVGMTTPLLPAPPPGQQAQAGRKRLLAMELWKDVSSSVQANLSAAGNVVENKLLEAAAAVDSALDVAFSEGGRLLGDVADDVLGPPPEPRPSPQPPAHAPVPVQQAMPQSHTESALA